MRSFRVTNTWNPASACLESPGNSLPLPACLAQAPTTLEETGTPSTSKPSMTTKAMTQTTQT